MENTSDVHIEGWDQPSFILFTIRQTRYPDCEKCQCRPIPGTDLVSGSYSKQTSGGGQGHSNYSVTIVVTQSYYVVQIHYGFDSAYMTPANS